ncbi:addiction module antidote protein [Glacieibacterium sp.]|uniref:addiction module antidote protein n=1 Tax=Glacieibacterium sp. TaxID=2860237 RepID=UPI003AFF6709
MTQTMSKTTRAFDAANYLDSEDAVIGYLDATLEEGDPVQFAHALGTIARSQGMTEIANRTGVKRQALYHALSEAGNPTLSTLTAVLDALGLRLKIERKAA